jgi:hypothetical protein
MEKVPPVSLSRRSLVLMIWWFVLIMYAMFAGPRCFRIVYSRIQGA